MAHLAGKTNIRSCIVSRQPFDKQALLRFVVGPQNKLFPDLAETLPGRGIWVQLDRLSVAKAATKNLFAKAAQKQVVVDPDLPDLVGKLLNERALMALSMARKAGLVIAGFSKVDTAIRSNQVSALLHANDAAEDGRRKLTQAVTFATGLGGRSIWGIDCWNSDQLTGISANGTVMHAALLPGGATTTFISHLQRWFIYEGWHLKKVAKIRQIDEESQINSQEPVSNLNWD